MTQLIESPPNDYDFLANELLREIFRGYPLDNVTRLIRSDTPEAIKAGAWLISELGLRAADLPDDIRYLLRHEIRNARYFGLDAVLVCGWKVDAVTRATALGLIEDPDEAIRRKTMTLLARLPLEVLRESVSEIRDLKLRSLTEWLVRCAADQPSIDEILPRLESSDSATRLFAAAAAARFIEQEPRAIQSAAQSMDPELSTFATRELENMRSRYDK